jgi:hypothetical protein
VSLQNGSVNDHSLLESFLSKQDVQSGHVRQLDSQLDSQENSNNQGVHLGQSQGGNGNANYTGNDNSLNERYVHENQSNKKQCSSNTVEIDLEYLFDLEKSKEKLVGVENELGLFREKLLALENELSLYKEKLAEFKKLS